MKNEETFSTPASKKNMAAVVIQSKERKEVARAAQNLFFLSPSRLFVVGCLFLCEVWNKLIIEQGLEICVI